MIALRLFPYNAACAPRNARRATGDTADVCDREIAFAPVLSTKVQTWRAFPGIFASNALTGAEFADQDPTVARTPDRWCPRSASGRGFEYR
jgi:hypothetical protein